MMMSFALGALAGRGDIYRVAYNWGLMGPESPKNAQVFVPAPVPSPGQVQAAATPAPPSPSASGNPSAPTPVKGAVAAPPASPAAAKKSTKPALGLTKQKDEDLRKLREEMARKLKFQNSLDTGHAKAAHKSGKQKYKEGDKTAAKAAPQPIKLAQFRDKKAAQAKLMDLQKQGEKVILKEGKDQTGQYYAIYRQPAGAASSSAAPKPKKSPGQTRTP
jgi:hypothetical protein